MGTIFSTVKIPQPVWPYSVYKKAWDLYFISWQIAIDGNTGNLVEWWIQEQTIQICKNLKAILFEIGLWLKDVIKTTVFMKNIGEFETMNDVYKDYFLLKPARSTVEVSALPKWALVEIECIAQKQEETISRNSWGQWRSI
jgi:2-iminobutanoate/2-iminopropanoate deaminase